MADRILVHCPRHIEDEPGLRVTELMQGPDGLKLSHDADGQPTALFEPVSRRWMGRPAPVQSTSNPFTMSVGSAVAVQATEQGGAGAQVTAEGSLSAPWEAAFTDGLQRGRGFYLDVFFYSRDSFNDLIDSVTIQIGDTWRFEFLPPEKDGAARWVTVLEKTGPPEEPWQPRTGIALLEGDYYGQSHQLWFQPLHGRELLVANRTNPLLGAVLRTDHPVTFDPDEGEEEDDSSEPLAEAPFDNGDLVLTGTARAFFVHRHLTYPTTWSLETDGPRELGYPGTQDVETEVSAWLPDGKPQKADPSDPEEPGSDWAATLAVYEQEVGGDDWLTSPDASRYAWKLTVTGLAERTAVVDRLTLAFPETVANDNASPTDLIGHASLKVTRLVEGRTEDPRDTQLRLTLTGPKADLDALLVPGARVQWIIDDGGVTRPRFDGLISHEPRQSRVYVEKDGPSYRAITEVTIVDRWLQADEAFFRGGQALDGLSLTEALTLCARQVPLKVDIDPDVGETEADTEISFAPTVDPTLPGAPPAERPAWLPQVGSRLGDVLQSLRDTFAPDCRLWFKPTSEPINIPTGDPPMPAASGAYVNQLTLEPRSTTSAAVFYRSAAEAVTALVPRQVIGGTNPLGLLSPSLDARDFYNFIVVVGQAALRTVPGMPHPADLPGEPIAAVYSNPSSWQLPTLVGGGPNPMYIGRRRPLVVVRPELTTQASVDAACLALADEYARFRLGLVFEGYLVPTLFPGDLLTLDAGTEAGAVDQVWRITAMEVTLEAGELNKPAERRYGCRYELGDPVAGTVPPDEGGGEGGGDPGTPGGGEPPPTEVPAP